MLFSHAYHAFEVNLFSNYAQNFIHTQTQLCKNKNNLPACAAAEDG